MTINLSNGIENAEKGADHFIIEEVDQLSTCDTSSNNEDENKIYLNKEGNRRKSDILSTIESVISSNHVTEKVIRRRF